MFDIHASRVVAFCVAVEGDIFRFSDLNAAATEHAGIRPEDQIGKRPEECFPPALADKVLSHYRVCAETNAPVVYETEFVLPNGYYNWRTTLIPFISAETGKVTSLVGFCQDCTADKITERATEAFNEKLSLAIGAIDGGFWVYEIATGAFETSQPLAEFIAGPGHKTLNLAEYASYVHVEDLGLGNVQNLCDDRSTCDYRVIIHDGRTRWLQSKRRVIRDKHGTLVRVVGLVIDITDQKTAFRTLEAEATTDPLTSLRNRRAFDRIVTCALREANADQKAIGLVLIDLDGFKPINDRHGHRAGDELLRKVARRIARHARKADTARIGGDEFAILVRDTSPQAADAFAARMRRAFAKPFVLSGQSLFVGVSTGVALSTPTDKAIGSLFERADQDLYAMKNRRRLLAG